MGHFGSTVKVLCLFTVFGVAFVQHVIQFSSGTERQVAGEQYAVRTVS